MTARLTAAIALALASPAGAQVITLDTGLLPSQQTGWRYEGLANDASTVETDVFSTDGSILTINSMSLPFGTGNPGTTHAVYDLDPASFNDDTIVTIDLRARVIESEVAVFIYGFYVGIGGGGLGFSTGFSTGTISLDTVQNIAFDNAQWHDYRWVGDWGAGTYELSIDGQSIATRPLVARTLNEFVIGDGTGTANAHAEIESLRIRIVPAPASAALLGLCGIVAARRRR